VTCLPGCSERSPSQQRWPSTLDVQRRLEGKSIFLRPRPCFGCWRPAGRIRRTGHHSPASRCPRHLHCAVERLQDGGRHLGVHRRFIRHDLQAPLRRDGTRRPGHRSSLCNAPASPAALARGGRGGCSLCASCNYIFVTWALTRHEVPHNRVNSVADTFAEPQFQARNAIVRMEDPDFGGLAAPCVVPRYSGSAAVVPRSGPMVGEHTEQVLGRLGVSTLEVEQLRALGAI
jgi:hypothetical protein